MLVNENNINILYINNIIIKYGYNCIKKFGSFKY